MHEHTFSQLAPGAANTIMLEKYALRKPWLHHQLVLIFFEGEADARAVGQAAGYPQAQVGAGSQRGGHLRLLSDVTKFLSRPELGLKLVLIFL